VFENFSPIYVVYAAAALTGIMVAEGCYLLYAGRSDKRVAINRRMKLQENKISQEQVLIQLRKELGLDAGTSLFSPDRFRALRTQSGMVMPLPRFLTITTGVALALMLAALWYGLPLLLAILLFVMLAPLLPVLVLRTKRSRRVKRFGVQLPEALELITRGLKAGHPVPVAISMVSREMPDPIGTEFGVISDEVTYGSDLVSALNSLFDRVGQEDLPLFVTAVSIQTSSGGNLREILDGLSTTIRERGKLRRKVKAMASEARFSAMILSALPIGMFFVVQFVSPDFYGSVWQYDMTHYILYGAATWMVLGNLLMYRMVNFKI
jgi:tight adherence protein B